MFKILIVVDMQKDFVTGSLGSESAVGIVENVVNKIIEYNKNNYLVIATLDTHQDNYLETLEGQKLPIKHCIEGTEGHDLIDKIRNCLNDETIILKKNTFASFELKAVIDEYLEKKHIPIKEVQVELIGLCSDICVISNAILLRTMFPNTKIVVDSSCCAGTTQEKHKASLEVMKSCQIDVN